MEIRLKAIGVIHMRASDAQVKEKGDQEREVEIFPNPIGLTRMCIMRREGSRIFSCARLSL
jgi:hypothetical protein